jgi:hypothetical protein
VATALGAGFVALFLLFGALRDIDFDTLARDPIAVAALPWYTGALSNLGVMLWVAAATACFLAAALAGRAGLGRDLLGFLLASGAVSSVLAVDDLFLIHERFPDITGITQIWLFAAYGAGLAAYGLRWKHRLMRGDIGLLAGSLFFLAASLGVDLSYLITGEYEIGKTTRVVLEDGAKFVGIVLWLTYFARLSFDAVARPGVVETSRGSGQIQGA